MRLSVTDFSTSHNIPHPGWPESVDLPPPHDHHWKTRSPRCLYKKLGENTTGDVRRTLTSYLATHAQLTDGLVKKRKEKMEGNRDEAEKCIKIATKALESGDKQKALKFLSKAEKLYPTERARGERDLSWFS